MKVLYVLLLFIALAFARFTLPAALPRVAGVFTLEIRSAYAQSAPLDRLEEKVEDIKEAVYTIATVLVLVALVFAGVRFLQGDPNSWRYLVYVFLGVLIVYGGGEIVEWLKS